MKLTDNQKAFLLKWAEVYSVTPSLLPGVFMVEGLFKGEDRKQLDANRLEVTKINSWNVKFKPVSFLMALSMLKKGLCECVNIMYRDSSKSYTDWKYWDGISLTQKGKDFAMSLLEEKNNE